MYMITYYILLKYNIYCIVYYYLFILQLFHDYLPSEYTFQDFFDLLQFSAEESVNN